MEQGTKRLLFKVYVASYLVSFLIMAIGDYGKERWLWSSFVFSILASPFSFLIGALLLTVFQGPFDWAKSKLKSQRISGKKNGAE